MQVPFEGKTIGKSVKVGRVLKIFYWRTKNPIASKPFPKVSYVLEFPICLNQCIWMASLNNPIFTSNRCILKKKMILLLKM